MPTVSIIIPCYNAEAYVGEAIRSALGQTYRNVEVIVVDDGSTDGSLEVIRSFGAALRWETGPKRGGCAARNRGLALARGELIQFLDSDDLLYPEKLSVQVPLVVAGKADIVYCDWQTMEIGRTDRIQSSSSTHDGEDPVCFMLKRQLQTAAPIHWKRRLESVGGFREGLPCSQERDLHLRLACSGASLYHLRELLVTVRRFPASVSSDFQRVLDQHSEIAWRAYRMLQGNGQLTDRRARHFAALLASDARAYLRLGQRERALEYFRQARLMHPLGGADVAYGRLARTAYRLLGPILTERLVTLKRTVVGPAAR